MQNLCWVNVIKVKAGLKVRTHICRKREKERERIKQHGNDETWFQVIQSTHVRFVASPGDVNAEAFLILVACSLFKIQSREIVLSLRELALLFLPYLLHSFIYSPFLFYTSFSIGEEYSICQTCKRIYTHTCTFRNKINFFSFNFHYSRINVWIIGTYLVVTWNWILYFII